jgi:uncharacterized protein (TIGR00369 family)
MTMTDEELKARFNSRMPPTSVLLGMEVMAVDQQAGTCRLKFDAKPEFCNPMGSVQGGFVAAMLDEAAAIATIIKSQVRIVVPTLEFKVTFFAPAKTGVLFAEGRCLKLGRQVAFMDATLLDASDRKLAAMTATAIPVPFDNPRLVERPA